jgi:hypothetical protein
MKRSLQISVLLLAMVVFNATNVFATPPSITPSGPSVAAVSTTYGYASSSVSFTFTAAALNASETVTIAAPAGFEVSLTAGSGYASSVTKNADGTGNIASTSIFVRLAAATGAGSYSGNVTLNGTTASANVATTSSTVSAKALTMSGLSVPASKVYDGSTAAVVSGSAALLSTEAVGSGTIGDGKPFTGDVVSITGTAVGTYNTKDVATATTVTYSGLSLTGAQAVNYSLTIQSPASATITAKTLSLDGTLTTSASKPYDGTTSATFGGSAALFASEAVGAGNTSDLKPYTGDAVSLTGSPVGTYNSKDVATATTITISGVSLTGAQAGNYTLLLASPSATITAKALTMSGLSVPASKIYDGTTSAVVSGSPTLQSSEAAGSGTNADGKPYTGDVVSITGSAVGTYNSKNVATATTVTYSGLSLTGAQAGNYSLTIQSAASATITAKALTMSGLSVPASKIYDGTTAAVVSGSAALQSSEAVGAGTTADGIPYTGDVVSITGAATGTYNSKNVATATTVNYGGLSLTGAQAGNYSLTIQSSASATITTKALTISGAVADNKTFDGTTAGTIGGTPALQTAEAPGAGSTADGNPYTGDVVSISGSGTGTFASSAPATGISVTGVSGYTLSGAQSSNYSPTQPTGLSASIFSAKPTAQSTAMLFSSITNTTLTVSWTVPGAGGGNNRILVVKQGGAPTAPNNGTASTSPTTYTDNPAFGSGSTTAAGSFVVYIGSGNSVALTGFTANTSYTFSLYELNSAGTGTENYNTTSPLSQTQKTEDEPLNYPTALTAAATTAAGNPVITLNWTGSIGSPAPANYLVLARDVTNSGSFPAFSDGSSVPGNDNDLSSQGSTWNGSQVIAFGTNTYNGWTNNKLTAGNLYEFQINPYTTAGIINPDYKTTPAAPTIQVYTEPTASASNPTFSNITPTSIDVTVAGGTGLGPVGGYIVTRKVGSAPLTAPTDGTVYTTASTIGGDPVVYVGAATTFTDGSLTALTNYYYNVYVYSGTGALINYKTNAPGNANTTTLCTPPVTQATSVNFGTTTAGTMVVNWTNGSGANRIVIVNSSPITFVPNSGSTYTANTDFSTGTDLGSGQKCVFNGSGSTVTISGLSGATTYYIAVYEYNTTGTCYNKVSPATGSKLTPSAATTSTFSAGSGGNLASTVITQGGEAAVFTFTATDLGVDGVSTRFTQLVFRPGAGNQVADWTQLFGTTGHAELYDNGGFGPAQHGTAIITANSITIPSISANNPPDLGSISDNSSRIYTLKVWLLSSLGGTLPSTVDNKHVEFSITGSDATPVATKSQFSAVTTTSSGADAITVTATQIKINQQPSAATLAYIALGTQPIFEATDVNNNRDLDINNAITVTTTNPTDLGPNSAPTHFVNGLANFTASGFNFHNTGTSTMAVGITTPTLTSPNTSSITVTASTALASVGTSMSPSPLTNNTTGVISGGTATNAVLGFSLATSGSPLTLSQLVFNSSVSTNGLVQNFKLYSNSVDSYTGATQIATSSSLTFSGLSTALTSSATYFFLVCDVDPYFPTASPTIQFSLPTSGVTVSAGSISGSTQTGINYALTDATPPVLQTITTLPGFLNSWATVWPNQMTTPAYNGNTADFLMTFSEPVLGMNTAKLTPQVSGLTSYSLLSVSPATSLGGAASSPSQYWRISYAITGSNNSGTVNGGYIFSEYSNSVPYVTDVALNQETTSSASRFIPAPPASDFYYVALPKPTNPVNPATLSAPTITTTSITLQWTQPAAPLGQIPTHYLVRAKESHLSFPTPVTNGQFIIDDPSPSDGYLAVNVTNTGYPALSPAVLSTTFSLNSGVSYDFEVYAYSKGSYPGAVEEIDYNTTPATITKSTLVANSAYINPFAAAATISSLTTTQPLAHAQSTPNLKFQVYDELFDQDNAPTKFSGVIIRQGTGNSGVLADWTQAIAGAELTDGTTVINASSITANQIIFTGISSTNPGDFGYVPDGTVPKTYSMNIWLKSSLGGTLPVSIDGKSFSFLVDQTSFTLDNTSSNQLSSTFQISSYNTGAGANVVDVLVSQLVYNVQPTTPIGVASAFPVAPVVYALDANNNRDLNYSNSAALSNTALLGQSINNQNFAAGVLTLNTFNFTTAGGPTQLTITGTGAPVVAPATSTVGGGITTVISNLTKITAGVGSEPTIFSSLTTAQSGAVLPQLNAALNFDFTITDDVGANNVTRADNDGLPTLFTALTITQDTNNGTNGGGDPLFDDWTNSIAGASLTDNLGNTITASSITATTINFTGISTATLGFIGDDGVKTYTLNIWLKNPVNSSLSDIIDNKDFVFDIDQTNITINAVANTSSTLQAGNATSGDTNNKVNVAATQLDFTTQWALNANQSYDAALSPSPIAKPRDANGNVDIDWSAAATVTTANPALYPPVNVTVTNNFVGGTRYYTFDPALQVSSSGGGANGASTTLVLSSAGIPVAGNGISKSFVLNYSGNSDIVQDNTFTYPTNILYASASNQQVAPLTGATGIALEQFLVRDGGASHADADGTPTVLNSITLDVTNYQNLREIALFQGGSGGTNIKELSVIPANYTVISANVARFVFSGFTFTAAKNTSAALTVKGSFLPTVTDNQIISFVVNAVGASSTGSSQFANTTPAGIQSTVTGNQNKIEVVATKISFTTVPTSASVNVPFQVIVQAQDANSNLDIDYNGTISSFGNTSAFTTDPAFNPSGAFSLGTYSYPYSTGPVTGFAFTLGNGNTSLTLNSGAANTGGSSVDAGAIAGTSPVISVITSFDSWLYFDPTVSLYTPLIDFVNHTENSLTTTSQALGLLVLSDGGAPGSVVNALTNPTPGVRNQTTHQDVDGAATTISSLTLSVSNFGLINKIALFDNVGTKIGEQTPSSSTVVFNSLDTYPNLVAQDNQVAKFYVRASFKTPVAGVTDHTPIDIQIVSVTQKSGSNFPENAPVPAVTIGGVSGGDLPPSGQNKLDVRATNLDFVTQPNPYAGINQPIDATTCSSLPYTGVVKARDIYQNIDLDFNSSYTLTAPANPTLTTPAFSAGILDLTGMKYTSVGRGDLTVVSTNMVTLAVLNSNTSAVPCSRVDVIDVGASLNPTGVVTTPNLKGGTSPIIFGLDVTPTYFVSTLKGDLANEPSIKSLTFSFSVPYKTSSYTAFTGFHIFEGSTDVINIGGTTVTQGKSVPASTNFDLVTVTFGTPRPLYTSASQTSPTRSYFLGVDVSVTANSTIPKIQPQLVDVGYGDKSIEVTQGSSSANVINGNTYGFASTKPPALIGANCTPYVGQMNVNPSITEIDLAFDVNVITFDGVATLVDKTNNNTVVANLTAINGNFIPGTPLTSVEVNPLRFSIPTGTVLKPDHVYYVTIPQGTFDPTANSGNGAGHGIADDQTNLYGGTNYNGTMYFKISSAIPPKMITTTAGSYNVSPSIASLNASFDQKGKAYYLILDHSKYSTTINKPTNAQIFNSALYSVPTAVVANGSFTINQISPNLQYFSVPGAWNSTTTYDVWIYAENDAIPTPVSTSAPYGGSATSFGVGLVGPTFSFTEPVTTGIPVYQLCPNSYTILSQPMILTETVANKWGIGTQDFNVLLPSGFDFDVHHAPNISLVGADFTSSATATFVNSSILNIVFTNIGSASVDNIIISDLRVIANGTGLSGDIGRFGGSGLPDYPTNSPLPSGLAKISSNALQPQTFTNSYTKYNNFGSLIKLSNVVTSIPDNFSDFTLGGKNATQLLPTITPSNDYYASFFTGSGVTDDVLNLTGVAKNTAFDITMTHTDLNGCFLSQTAQYTVYDHTDILPALTDPVYGPKQGLKNINFITPSDVTSPLTPAAPSQLSAAGIKYTDIAGYKLDSMAVVVPLDAQPLAANLPTSQIIYGTQWQSQLNKLLIQSPQPLPYTNSPYPQYYRDYKWDYSHILNAKIESGNAIALNPYDNFKTTTGSNSNNYYGGNQVYYTGGSLGFVDFIGKFESTADGTIYQPLVQRIQLFVPPVPVIEVVGQSHVTPKTVTSPDIFVFCEHGSDIVFNGYPAASPGKSTAHFTLYDDASNTVLTGAGFVDNANSNGTATLTPSSAAYVNSHNTIRVEYTYQDNNSPISGIGKFYIQIAPNPIADFTFTSVVSGTNSPNASTSTSYCANNQIDFVANINNPNYKYTWDFSDANSASPAAALGLNIPSHTFSKSSGYNVSLNMISDFGCPSIPFASPQGVIPGARIITVKVGDIPTLDFNFAGNCVNTPMSFTDNSSTPVGANSTVAQFVWDFGDGGSASGKTVAHTYSSPKSWKVLLATTTDLGCRDTLSKYVGQLPSASYSYSSFQEKFNNDNGGGWIALNLNGQTPVVGGTSWVYDNTKWMISNNYQPGEKSALYSACIDLTTILRPAVQFDSYFDFRSGDGLVLQYSTDNLNIQDPLKSWNVLGTTGDGLDWYSNIGVPSNPGTGYANANNSHGYGWENSLGLKAPKHSLDTIGKIGPVVLRWAFNSGNSQSQGTGAWIDNVRIGSRTRTILFENFTTTNPAPASDVNTNNTFKAEADTISKFVSKNLASTQLVNINYHVGLLGQDPFNLDNPQDPSARALYYGVSNVPYAFFDGKHNSSKQYFKDWGSKAYDLQTLNLAKADFLDSINNVKTTVTSATTDGTVQVNVNFTPQLNLPVGDQGHTVLHVAILEKLVTNLPKTGAINTGETQFYYVLKKMLPNATGTRLAPLTAGDTILHLGVPVKTASIGDGLPFKWLPDKLYNNTLTVVTFLQNEETKEVYQAEYFDVPKPSNVVTGIEPISSENIKVYPNPADQEFMIELPYAAKGSISIQLANQLGQFTQLGSFNEGEQSKKVSTQGLADGVYILQLGSNGDALRTKIIVLHK